MDKILVWDYPTRLLHWLLTFFFFAAIATHGLSRQAPAAFHLHLLFGLAAALIVLLRIVWGLIGTQYARFTSFIFSPQALWQYLREAFRRSGMRHIGHNPGSSYAIYAMLFLTLALAVTGLVMPYGSRLARELHGPLAAVMSLIVLAHLAGIVWHTIRYRENIAMSMIHGRKAGDPAQAIASPLPAAGMFFFVLVSALTIGLFAAYDQPSGRLKLPFVGQVLIWDKTDPGSERHEGNRSDYN